MSSSKTNSAIIGGFVAAILGTLFGLLQYQLAGQQLLSGLLSCFTCLSAAVCGLVAVWHYTDTNELTISGGSGAGLGALAGVFYGLIGGVFGMILRFVGLSPTAEDAMQQMRDSGAFDQMDANAQQFMTSMMEFLLGPASIVIGIVIGVILGVIGGAIGATIFKKGSDDKNDYWNQTDKDDSKETQP